jgi:hypothetical protein
MLKSVSTRFSHGFGVLYSGFTPFYALLAPCSSMCTDSFSVLMDYSDRPDNAEGVPGELQDHPELADWSGSAIHPHKRGTIAVGNRIYSAAERFFLSASGCISHTPSQSAGAKDWHVWDLRIIAG